MKIMHILKRDVRKSTRVLMQTSWDDEPLVLHRGPPICSPLPAYPLGLRALWQHLKGEPKTFVIHEQGALIFLIAIYLFRKITGVHHDLVYDIHDIMEPPVYKTRAILGYMKNGINFILEDIALRLFRVPALTVSEGLSLHYHKLYGTRPVVVRNIPEINSNDLEMRQRQDFKKPLIVYFGFLSRFPFEALVELESAGFVIDHYGTPLDSLKNFDLKVSTGVPAYDIYKRFSTVVRQHSEFTQKDMGFVNQYDILVISMNENTANVRYSLPNKVFQALAKGLRVLAFGDFVELRQFFSRFPKHVVIQEYFPGALTVAVKNMVSDNGANDYHEIVKYLQSARGEAEQSYRSMLSQKDRAKTAIDNPSEPNYK